MYAIGLTPLLNMKLEAVVGAIMAAFADDLTAISKCTSLRSWWGTLVEYGPSFGYLPQARKSWLIVKQQHLDQPREIFKDTEIQISTRGERHLGALVGEEDFKREYCQKLTGKWVEEVKILSEIALTQPQSAYACFVLGRYTRFPVKREAYIMKSETLWGSYWKRFVRTSRKNLC